MQSRSLTADEPAEMINCSRNSYACMRRHLERNRGQGEGDPLMIFQNWNLIFQKS